MDKKKKGYKPKTINIKPFEDFNTDDARGKTSDEFKKIKLLNINDIAK